MHLKLFEVRDRMTFIPCFAFLTSPSSIHPMAHAEDFLLRRAGFDPALPQIIFGTLECLEKTKWDPNDWRDRTMTTAHEYIQRNWYALNSGDVIDIEFIKGERESPKLSENFRASFDR